MKTGVQVIWHRLLGQADHVVAARQNSSIRLDFLAAEVEQLVRLRDAPARSRRGRAAIDLVGRRRHLLAGLPLGPRLARQAQHLGADEVVVARARARELRVASARSTSVWRSFWREQLGAEPPFALGARRDVVAQPRRTASTASRAASRGRRRAHCDVRAPLPRASRPRRRPGR